VGCNLSIGPNEKSDVGQVRVCA